MKKRFYIDPVTGLVTIYNPREKGDGSIASTKGGK